MHTLLIVAPDDKNGPAGAIASGLIEGFRIARLAASTDRDAADALALAFDGCPPDILLADLSHSASALPLRHTHRLLQRVWGDNVPRPLRIALLDPQHVGEPDWMAEVDDFLIPPYTASEARARIHLQLLRKRSVAVDRITVADVVIELDGGRAIAADGAVLPLTPREFDLLRFLATHRGKFFSRDRLLDLVWGVDFDGGERTVDIHMVRLRTKLPPEAAKLLETRRGVGYGLIVP